MENKTNEKIKEIAKNMGVSEEEVIKMISEERLKQEAIRLRSAFLMDYVEDQFKNESENYRKCLLNKASDDFLSSVPQESRQYAQTLFNKVKELLEPKSVIVI